MFGKKSNKPRKENEAKAKERISEFKHLLRAVERLSGLVPIRLAALELTDNETVEYAAVGEYQDRDACMLLTDQRIIICSRKGLTISNDAIEYKDIDRVETGIGLNGSWVSFHYSSTKATLEKSAHGEFNDIRDIVKKYKSRDATVESRSESETDIDQLSELARLHATGALTDGEFAAAKAKTLGL